MNIKKKLNTILLPIIVGLMFVLGIIVWYKQFSYFNYVGDNIQMDDISAARYAEKAEERDFYLDKKFSARVGRIIFWTNEFEDICITNNTDRAIRFTAAEYYGDEIPELSDPFVIESGESYEYVSGDNPGCVITAYAAADDVDLSKIQISHDNAGYMSRWKRAVYAVLFGVVIWTVLSVVVLFLTSNKGNRCMAWISFGMGSVCLMLGITVSVVGIEPWADCVLSIMGAFGCVIAFFMVLVGYMGNDTKATAELRPLLCGGGAMALSVLFFFFMITLKRDALIYRIYAMDSSPSRIVAYVMSFILFIVLYLILGRIPVKWGYISIDPKLFADRLLFVSALLFLIILLRHIWGYGGQNPLGVFVVMMVIFVIGSFFSTKGKKFPPIVWHIYYAGLSIFYFWSNIIINFHVEGYNMNHTDLYYRSVCFVATGEPIPGSGLDNMYGNYSLFYLIPMKIFGANMRTIAVFTGVSAGVALLCALLLMHRLVRQSWLRALGGMLILSSMTISWLYLQIFPCRMLFPFVLLLFISRCQEKGKMVLGRKMTGYFLCMLAILWNLETGLVCAVAYAVYLVMRRTTGKLLFRYFRAFGTECVLILVETVIATLIVRIYNFVALLDDMGMESALRKGLLSAQPGDGYMEQYLTLTENGFLRWGNAPWLYIMILIMILTIMMLSRSEIFRNGADNGKVAGYIAGIIVMLGYFTYWMTRPEEYNIMAPTLVIALLIIYEKVALKLYGDKAKKKKMTFIHNECNVLVIVYIITCFSVGKFIYSVPGAVDSGIQRIDNRLWSYEVYKDSLADFAAMVPDDSVADGYGLREIYLDLGWRYRDVSSIELSENEYVVSDKSDWNKGTYEDYEIIRIIPLGMHNYYLYGKQISE